MAHPLTFVQTGDLHLGSPFAFAADKAPLLLRAQLDAFIAIIRLCQQVQADVLLIAGDLFDQPVPDATLVRTVRELLGSLGQTRVLIAPGNHDPAALDSPYRQDIWPAPVKIFMDSLERIEWPDARVRLYGCGFTSTVAPVPLPFVPPEGLAPDWFNLCLVHGDLNGPVSSPYNPLTAANLAGAGYDYVALGHLHAFSGFQKERQTTFAYAGCPFGRGFDEIGTKGVIVGTVSPSQSDKGRPTLNLRFAPIDGRRFLVQTVDVTGCQDHRQAADKILASLKAGVGNSWPDHLYKIILAGDRTLDFTLSLPVLDSLLAGQLFWYRLVDETRLPVDLADLAREHSLRGAFVRQAQSALQQATESGQAHERQILVQALDLGLAAMRGEEVWYETDPA
jgi:hypothetical protein